jgi:hypothetical protein
MYERIVSRARLEADPVRWEGLWTEGAAMDTDQAVAYASALAA